MRRGNFVGRSVSVRSFLSRTKEVRILNTTVANAN
jgi:hypothetical protein